MSVFEKPKVKTASTERKGRYIGTTEGRRFWPLDPRAEEVHPADISFSLSNKCRWGSYTYFLYSVAQHVLHGVELAKRMPLPPEDEHLRRDIIKYFFLHDSHEAYLADIPSPVKSFIPGWRGFEYAVDLAIWERFGLPEIPDKVKKYVRIIDRWSLGMEVGAVVDRLPDTYYPEPPSAELALACPVAIGYVDPVIVRSQMMEMFRLLFPAHIGGA